MAVQVPVRIYTLRIRIVTSGLPLALVVVKVRVDASVKRSSCLTHLTVLLHVSEAADTLAKSLQQFAGQRCQPHALRQRQTILLLNGVCQLHRPSQQHLPFVGNNKLPLLSSCHKINFSETMFSDNLGQESESKIRHKKKAPAVLEQFGNVLVMIW